MVSRDFWNGKKVFITGHTGFKGTWLSIWLCELGAIVVGYSKDLPTEPSLFETSGISRFIKDIRGDVRNYDSLFQTIKSSQPEIVIHMAAQSLVRYSYIHPKETYETNVMGTVNLLEAVRNTPSVKSCVIITTDKCYENKEWEYGYREHEPMGGYDPYSSSKGAAELVVSAYIRSYFDLLPEVVVCSARAGNVIGGGDWALDRIVPDIVNSIVQKQKVKLRNPKAIRPWQHVLEPLSGYLLLAEQGFKGNMVSGAWNFGPRQEDAKTVQWLTEKMGETWGLTDFWEIDGNHHPHEAHYLKLDISKADFKLNWRPKWDAERAIKQTALWYLKPARASMRWFCERFAWRTATE